MMWVIVYKCKCTLDGGRWRRGLEEVTRIEKEMMDIVVEMGYSNLTLQQFSEMIRYNRQRAKNKRYRKFTVTYSIVQCHVLMKILSNMLFMTEKISSLSYS